MERSTVQAFPENSVGSISSNSAASFLTNSTASWDSDGVLFGVKSISNDFSQGQNLPFEAWLLPSALPVESSRTVASDNERV